MRMRAVAVMMVLGLAGPVGAADLGSDGVATQASVVATPTPLEWLRYMHPREGRNVTIAGNGTSIPSIEWRYPVEVRVRTESGAALPDRERAAIRDLALVCDRGEVRDVTERTEPNGTYVVEYGCAWLQGFDRR